MGESGPGPDSARELSTGRSRPQRRMGESEPARLPDPLTAQAALEPDKPAVIDPEGERLTYAELEARVNRLAHGLAGSGSAAATRSSGAAPTASRCSSCCTPRARRASSRCRWPTASPPTRCAT